MCIKGITSIHSLQVKSHECVVMWCFKLHSPAYKLLQPHVMPLCASSMLAKHPVKLKEISDPAVKREISLQSELW